MAKKPIRAQLMPIIARSKTNMNALVQESVQRTVDIAQFPGPSVANGGKGGKGGKMPIDTGFLRASGQLRLNGMPTGPTRPDGKGKRRAKGSPFSAPRINDRDATLGLSGFTLGLTIFFGWTAVYAKRMNLRYGFLDNAVAQWPKTVRNVTKEILRRSL